MITIFSKKSTLNPKTYICTGLEVVCRLFKLVFVKVVVAVRDGASFAVQRAHLFRQELLVLLQGFLLDCFLEEPDVITISTAGDIFPELYGLELAACFWSNRCSFSCLEKVN